jgi:hypothetical protein
MKASTIRTEFSSDVRRSDEEPRQSGKARGKPTFPRIPALPGPNFASARRLRAGDADLIEETVGRMQSASFLARVPRSSMVNSSVHAASLLSRLSTGNSKMADLHPPYVADSKT